MSDKEITTDELLSGFIKDVEKRISELEKNVKAWADGQRIGAKEIAELQEWRKVFGETLETFRTCQNSHQIQLNELKEAVKEAPLMIMGCWDDTRKVKEVLRELGEWILAYMYDTGISPPLMRKDLEKTLEKLDSQGKTEKIPPGFTKETWDIALKHIKDSGGEKDWFNNGWCAPYWKVFKQHSKPPEPITPEGLDIALEVGIAKKIDESLPDSKPPEPYSIFSDFIPIEGKWYHLKAEIKKDSANVFIDYIQVYGDEPREEDPIGKNIIMVKREDLQKMYYNMSPEGIITDGGLEEYYDFRKRIKEAYGIE